MYIDAIEESYNKAVDAGSEEIAFWALRNVPELLRKLRLENELAENYSGLCK